MEREKQVLAPSPPVQPTGGAGRRGKPEKIGNTLSSLVSGNLIRIMQHRQIAWYSP
jgi:hypothetical protein